MSWYYNFEHFMSHFWGVQLQLSFEKPPKKNTRRRRFYENASSKYVGTFHNYYIFTVLRSTFSQIVVQNFIILSQCGKFLHLKSALKIYYKVYPWKTISQWLLSSIISIIHLGIIASFFSLQPTKFLKICFKKFIAVGKVRRSNSSCGAKLKKRCSFFISCVVKILP